MTLARYLMWVMVISFLSTSCAHEVGGGKQRPQSKSREVKISEKQNSIYYYLVSELKSMQGDQVLASNYLDKALEKSPGSSHLAVKKGYDLARADKYDEAIRVVLQAYKIHPENYEINFLLAKLYSARGEREKSFLHYEKALRLADDQTDIYGLLASEYLSADRVDDAIKTILKWLEVDSAKAPPYFMLGSIYATQLKNFTKAVRYYELALEEDPRNPKVQQVLVEAYLAQKNFNKALNILRSQVEGGTVDVATRIRIGVLLYEQNRLDESIREFESILSIKPDDSKILYYLGLLNEEKKADEKARFYYDQVAVDSQFFNDAIVRHVVTLRRQQKVPEALAWLDQKIARHPDVIGLYQTKASLLVMEKRDAEAVKVLKQALQKKPGHEDLLMNLGMVYESLKQRDLALDMMKQVIALNSSNATALNYVGYSYAEKGENLDEAEKLIQKALSVKPEDGMIMDSLGWVYFQKKEYAKALEWLERAVQKSPKEPTILEHAADAHLQLSNKVRARMYYEKSLVLLRQAKALTDEEKEQVGRLVKKLSEL